MRDTSTAGVLLAVILLLSNAALSAPDPGPGLAPHMDFVPNAAGTYQLQRIQQCPDAVLLNASAGARRLSAYTRGKVTLLTFFYTYCTDPWGCPFAYQTMKTLRDRIAADPSLKKLRLGMRPPDQRAGRLDVACDAHLGVAR